jgi:hypothetical protein
MPTRFRTIEFLPSSPALVPRRESQFGPMAKQMLARQCQGKNVGRTLDVLLPFLFSVKVKLVCR